MGTRTRPTHAGEATATRAAEPASRAAPSGAPAAGAAASELESSRGRGQSEGAAAAGPAAEVGHRREAQTESFAGSTDGGRDAGLSQSLRHASTSNTAPSHAGTSHAATSHAATSHWHDRESKEVEASARKARERRLDALANAVAGRNASASADDGAGVSPLSIRVQLFIAISLSFVTLFLLSSSLFVYSSTPPPPSRYARLRAPPSSALSTRARHIHDDEYAENDGSTGAAARKPGREGGAEGGEDSEEEDASLGDANESQGESSAYGEDEGPTMLTSRLDSEDVDEDEDEDANGDVLDDSGAVPNATALAAPLLPSIKLKWDPKAQPRSPAALAAAVLEASQAALSTRPHLTQLAEGWGVDKSDRRGNGTEACGALYPPNAAVAFPFWPAGVPWVPQPNRFLLSYCVRGQISNRVLCHLNHVLLAALLNRTLVVPLRETEQATYPYNLNLAWDLERTRACYGENTVISTAEFERRNKGSRISLDRLQCWHGVKGSCYKPLESPSQWKNCPGIAVSKRYFRYHKRDFEFPQERPLWVRPHSTLHKHFIDGELHAWKDPPKPSRKERSRSSRKRGRRRGSKLGKEQGTPPAERSRRRKGSTASTKGPKKSTARRKLRTLMAAPRISFFKASNGSMENDRYGLDEERGVAPWLVERHGQGVLGPGGLQTARRVLAEQAKVMGRASCMPLTPPLKKALEELLPLKERVIAVGDMVNVGFNESETLASFGELTFLSRLPSCPSSWSLLMPPVPVLDRARAITRQLFRGGRYVGVHWRRGDFGVYCSLVMSSYKCFYSPAQAANCTLRVANEHGIRRIFLATNADVYEVEGFKSYIQKQSGGSVKVKGLPRLKPGEVWVPPELGGEASSKSVLLRILLEKLIVAQSSVFLGSTGSTFTRDIQRMRHLLGRSLCEDTVVCHGEQEWGDGDEQLPAWARDRKKWLLKRATYISAPGLSAKERAKRRKKMEKQLLKKMKIWDEMIKQDKEAAKNKKKPGRA